MVDSNLSNLSPVPTLVTFHGLAPPPGGRRERSERNSSQYNICPPSACGLEGRKCELFFSHFLVIMLRALGARGGAVAAAALLVLAGITRTYSAATAPSVRVPAVLEYGNLRAYYEKVAAAPTPEETISAVDYFVTLQWRETPEYPWADDTEAALDLWIKACSVPSVDRDVQRGMLRSTS